MFTLDIFQMQTSPNIPIKFVLHDQDNMFFTGREKLQKNISEFCLISK